MTYPVTRQRQYGLMKKAILFISLSLCLSGCAYFWESVLSAPGPQVVHERTWEKEAKGGKVSQSNWWTGDGQSHWCYCWESKGTKVCSGDCR